jgi:SAM-dependent methyltransferase
MKRAYLPPAGRPSPKRRKAAPTAYRAIADYYDPEYAHLDYLDRDVPFYMDHLPRRPQRILELAVGTARAAIPLAQLGHRLTGVDYAADMLRIATEKRDGVGLTDRDLRLVRGDLLKLNLGQSFDRAAIFFNSFLSFTTLAQQDRVLRNVANHLTKGGTFWLDIFNPDHALLATPEASDLDPISFYVPSLSRTVFRTTDISRDEQLQTQRITFRYLWFDERGTEHCEVNSFLLGHIFPRELQLLLERNGFDVKDLYGDHDGSAVEPASPRLIAWCRKR